MLTLSKVWGSVTLVIRFYLEEKRINEHILYTNRNYTYIIYEQKFQMYIYFVTTVRLCYRHQENTNFLKTSVKAKIMTVEHRHVEDETCGNFFSLIIEIL